LPLLKFQPSCVAVIHDFPLHYTDVCEKFNNLLQVPPSSSKYDLHTRGTAVGPSAPPSSTADINLISSDNYPPTLTLCERSKRNSPTHVYGDTYVL